MSIAQVGERAKFMGAYYTDSAVARFLLRWGVRSRNDRVLDPSFGGGVFLAAAADRFHALGGSPEHQVFGVEIDAHVFERVSRELSLRHGIRLSNILHRDFFALDADERPPFDVVVGNPPFIRYQSFAGPARDRALCQARRSGVRLSGLSSSWAPFIVHSAAMIRSGGRMAMVVPMELGHATYARPVLDFLRNSFAALTLLTFRTRLFPQLAQDTMLLLADGKGGSTRGFDIADLPDAASLDAIPLPVERSQFVASTDLANSRTKLIMAFIPPRARDLYCELSSGSTLSCRLGDVANVGIGYVSGNNDFFHVSPERATAAELPASVLAPAVYRGRALRGAAFDANDWQEAARSGDGGLLLKIDPEHQIDDRTRTFLLDGEGRRVHETYKCRTRTPWYSVPNVYMPDAFLTYMSAEGPRFVTNDAGAYAPNTLHVVRLLPMVAVSPQMMAALWHSSLTGLSCEIEGHAMGGGLLKLEPIEARDVRLARPSDNLKTIAKDADTLIRGKGPEALRNAVDEVVLQEQLGLSERDISTLRAATQTLRQRRTNRRGVR